MLGKAKRSNLANSRKPQASLMSIVRKNVEENSRQLALPSSDIIALGGGSLQVIARDEDLNLPKRSAQMINLPGVKLNSTQKIMAEKQEAFKKEKPLGSISEMHKQILQWTYPPESRSLLPPNFEQSRLQSIPKLFRNARDYQSVMEPLLILECWAQFCQAGEELRNDQVFVKMESALAVDGFYELEFSAEATANRQVQDQDLVQLCEVRISGSSCSKLDNSQEVGTIPILAKIDSVFVKKSVGKVVAKIFPSTTRPDLVARLRPGSCWKITKILSLITVHREYTAMLNLPMLPLHMDIMNPSRMKGGFKPSASHIKELAERFQINEPQASAVASAIGQKSGFVLIQGPPGIYSLINRNRQNQNDNDNDWDFIDTRHDRNANCCPWRINRQSNESEQSQSSSTTNYFQ